MEPRRSSRISIKRSPSRRSFDEPRDSKKVKLSANDVCIEDEDDALNNTASKDDMAITNETTKEKPNDNTVKPFRLLNLPAEIRIEIYRACLTRPFDILLSKPPPPTKNIFDDMEVGVVDEAEEEAYRDPLLVSTHDWARVVGSPQRTAAQARAHRAQNTESTPRSLRISNRMRLSRTHRPPGERQTPARPEERERRPELMMVPRQQIMDPLLVTLLRTSKLVYKEARPVLYGENSFVLDIDTALSSLAALHQRSRSKIRFLHLTIPSHSEILERFAEVVRLSLRYCWKLQILTINMPFLLPGTDGTGHTSNTTVYANAFDILRWLPKQCRVVLEGNVSEDIRKVVEQNANLAKNLDELAYARRQLISNVAVGRTPP